jgi:hypothetical protein
MTRVASVHSRGGLVAVFALVACWSSAPPPTTTPVGNAGGGGSGDAMIASRQGLEGQYWCSITSTGDLGKFEYPKFPCTITREDGHLVLAKLGGSQRFTGEIAALGSDDGRAGFRFAGQFYCPWGSCTSQLHGEFRPGRDGAFQGRFSDDTNLHVRLWRAAPNELAGVGYGGAMYGGAMYGGAMYGGTTYAGRRHRRNYP